MAFNGSGTYVLPGAALADGQTISATEHNALRNDMATALTTCVTRDGQSPATANIPMGGFKHTGLAAGTGNGESVRYDEFNGHLVDASGAHAASAISNTPAGGISATDVQAALNELDTEKTSNASAAITGGTINGSTIGGVTPGAGTFTTLVATGGTINGSTIGGVTPGAGTFTTLTATGGITSTSGSSGIGYGTGAGGTVTQATSKSTGVTLNTTSGVITMNNAALASGAFVEFVLTNSRIAATDGVVATSGTFGINYRVETYGISGGAVGIRVVNKTAGSLSEALVINFQVIKGASA